MKTMVFHTLFPTHNFTSISPLYTHSLTKPTFNIISKNNRNPYKALQTVTVVSTPIQAAIDVDSLNKEFGGHGVSFSSLSDGCVVTLSLKNGCVAKLMLPSGLITSYKAMMWHGGTMELLHTTVSNGNDGEAIILGGVSMAFLSSFDIQGNSTTWPNANSWFLHNVTGNPHQSIQVHLINKHEGNVEVEHILTMEKDYLKSEVVIRNLSDSLPLRFVGSIMSHLNVSTPEATFVCGLEGSDFCNTAPVSTDFSLIHPAYGKKNQSSRSILGPMELPELVSHWNTMRGTQDVVQVEEDDEYKNLADEMSIIYTNAPRSFTIMDKGKRNSLIVGRVGFDELYMFSPGSSHPWYGRYAYICVGQAALLQPVTLESKGEWRGEQHLLNPNL